MKTATEMLIECVSENPVGVKESFNDLIKEKIANILEQKKMEVSTAMFADRKKVDDDLDDEEILPDDEKDDENDDLEEDLKESLSDLGHAIRYHTGDALGAGAISAAAGAAYGHSSGLGAGVGAAIGAGTTSALTVKHIIKTYKNMQNNHNFRKHIIYSNVGNKGDISESIKYFMENHSEELRLINAK